MMGILGRALAVAFSIVVCGASGRALGEDKPVDYAPAVEQFKQAAAAELAHGHIHGVSVALVVDQKIVFAGGFGYADAARKAPATAQTIYRAGSISKLFNALAAAQLSEQGKLDLDAPIQNYVPGFRLLVPFEPATPITARQILCHRSGLVRESPVGGYFDGNGPTIAASVESLAGCVLVNPPNTKTRYSNIAPTVLGQAVEKISGQSFIDYQQRHLLDPLVMTSSCWVMNDKLRPRLATGYMQVARPAGGFDEQPAPQFELGTIPAGNLYTTVEDLARLVMMISAEGRGEKSAVVGCGTLAEMLSVQLTGENVGFGLGFVVGKQREYKTVGHMGAVYGFTTSVVAVPDARLGVVVLTNGDIAVGPTRRLAAEAIDVLLAAQGESVPDIVTFSALPEELSALSGDYESPSYWAEVKVENGVATASVSGQKLTLTPTGKDQFLADGRIAHREPLVVERAADGSVIGFTLMRQTFRRIDPKQAPAVPDAWQKFVGSYGPKYIPLHVTLRHGRLYAMTENEFDYRLTPLNRFVFRMPPGLYDDEHLVFQCDADGRAHSAVLANMTLPRLPD